MPQARSRGVVVEQCPSHEDLRLLLEAPLGEAEDSRLAAHLERCQVCRAFLDELTRLTPLQEMQALPDQPVSDAWSDLLERMKETPPESRRLPVSLAGPLTNIPGYEIQ